MYGFRIAGLLVAGLFGLLASGSFTVARAADPTPTQARAQTDIEEKAPKLVKLAYITSKGSTSTKYVKGTAYRDGSFDLTYKFYYKDSDGDPQSYTQRFQFDEKGKLTGLVTVDHSSFWAPYDWARVAGAALDEVSKALDK